MAINLNYNVKPSVRPDSDAFGPRPIRDPGGLQQSAQALQSVSQSMANIADVLDKKEQAAQQLLVQKSYSNWNSAFNIAQENYKQAINKGNNEEIEAAQLEFEKFKTFNPNSPEYVGKSSGVVVNRESIMQPYVNAASESYKARENEFKHLKPYAVTANTVLDLTQKTESHLTGLKAEVGVGNAISEEKANLAIYGDPTNPNNPGILNNERDEAIYNSLSTAENKEAFLSDKLFDILSISKNQIEQSLTEQKAQEIADKYLNIINSYPLFANLQNPGEELADYLATAKQNITNRNNQEAQAKHNFAVEHPGLKGVFNFADVTLNSQNAITFHSNLSKLKTAIDVYTGSVTDSKGNILPGQYNLKEDLDPTSTEYKKLEDIEKLYEFATTTSEGAEALTYTDSVLGSWMVNHLNTPIAERPVVNQYFSPLDAIQLNDLSILNNYITTLTDTFDRNMAEGNATRAIQLIDPEIATLIGDGELKKANLLYKRKYLEGYIDLEKPEFSRDPLLSNYVGAPNGLVNVNTDGFDMNDKAINIASSVQEIINKNPGELIYNLHNTAALSKNTPTSYTTEQKNLYNLLDLILPTILDDPNFDPNNAATLDQTKFQVDVKQITDMLENYNARSEDKDDPIISKINNAVSILTNEENYIPIANILTGGILEDGVYESYLGNRIEMLQLEGGNTEEIKMIKTMLEAKVYDLVKDNPNIDLKKIAHELAKFEQNVLNVPTNTVFNAGGLEYKTTLPAEFDDLILRDKNNVPIGKHENDGLFGLGEFARSFWNIMGAQGIDFNPETDAEQAKLNAISNVAKARSEEVAMTYTYLVLSEGLLTGSFDYNGLRQMAQANDWDYDFENPKYYDSKKQKFTRAGVDAFIKGMMRQEDDFGKPMSMISGYAYETRFGERVKVPVVMMSSGSGYVKLKTNSRFPSVQHFANETKSYIALEQSTHIGTWKLFNFQHSMKDRILDRLEDTNRFGDDYVGPLKRSVQLSAPLVVNPTDIITK